MPRPAAVIPAFRHARAPTTLASGDEVAPSAIASERRLWLQKQVTAPWLGERTRPGLLEPRRRGRDVQSNLGCPDLRLHRAPDLPDPGSADALAPLRTMVRIDGRLGVFRNHTPFSWPKSAHSTKLGGTAVQSKTMKGPDARGLCSWMASASSSFPVPVSPSTVKPHTVFTRPDSAIRTSQVTSDAPSTRAVATRTRSAGSHPRVASRSR